MLDEKDLRAIREMIQDSEQRMNTRMTEMANESNRRLDTGRLKRDFRLRQRIARMAEIPFSYGRALFPPGTDVPDDSFFAR